MSIKPQIAKLTRPRLAGVVERGRLYEHLDRTAGGRIIWISAPAGSGKTTLVASWLDSRRLPCLWYQADEGDGDIATFFSFLGKAAKSVAPKYRKPLPLFTPEYSLGIPTFTKRYFEELYARLLSAPPKRAAARRRQLPRGPVIVIDNYQDVPADTRFHEVLRDGLGAAPEGVSVVIVSRADPPPVYARLQAGDRLEVIRTEEIWFTLDEGGALIESRGKKPPPDDALKALFQKTEGWAAGLVLMSEHIAVYGDTGDLSNGNTEGVFDYFAAELLGSTDPETRDFLVRTALFPSMTAKNAAALTGNDHADHILSGLSRSNFFVQRHATPELVYQYHPLFREFLLSRAKELIGQDEAFRIKKKAAQLLLASGQVESSAELLAETGDWDGYALLVLTHAPSLASQGRFATLMEWIERIPKPVFDSRPWLAFWLGVCKKPVNPPQSRALFERALDLFQTQGDTAGLLLAWAEIVDTFLYEWNDFHPLDRWITWLDGRMQADPSFPSPEIEARVASCMVDALVFRRPDHPEIKKWVERALKSSEEIADAGQRLQAYLHVANYYLWVGDKAKSYRMVEKIRNIARTPFTTPLLIITSNWGEAVTNNIFSPDFDASLHLIEEGIEMAEKNGIHIWNNFLYGFGAYSALCRGDLALAGRYLTKMETTFATGQFQNVVLQHHLSAWRFFLLGDLDRALVSGEKALAGAIESGNITNIELCNHNMANIYDALGDHQRATAYLALALESNRKWQGLSLEFACLVTKAYFALRWGETAAGIEVLRKAMSLGRSQGYMGVFFWWDPRAMVYLCAIALDAGIEVEYVQTLIRKRNLVPDSSLVVPESWPWPVKIYTLGRFELNIDDKPVLFPGKVQQKPLALLKALIAFGGRDVSEEQLTDELWPDSEGDTGHVAFDTTLHRLRKLVGNEKALILRDGMLSLDDRYCWTDVGAFEKIIAECGLRNAEGRTKTGAAEITSAQSETALFEKAINLYKGHFLPGDTKQPWSISLRERLRARFHNSVSSLGRHWVDTGRYDNAVQVFLKGLEIDDLAEEFYQHLMACYHQMGQQTAAIKTYHRCCGVLQSSLGLKPSSKTEGVYYSIRQNG